MPPRAWSPLAAQALAGAAKDLRRLAADGVLPLPSAELLALQIALAGGPGKPKDDDPETAQRARAALRAVEPSRWAEFFEQDASPGDLDWVADEITHPDALAALMRRRTAAAETLERLAPRVGPALQETLLLRQDRIVERPAILEALERNPQLAPESRRRIAEYREHLLPREKAPPATPEPDEDEASDSEVSTALAVARTAPAAGEHDDVTGLSEGQVRGLPIKVRRRLARNASASLRHFLLRDPDPRVAMSVLNSGAISDSEVEQVARGRSVHEDVLEAIGCRREWCRRYPIVLALVSNPRTPVPTALRLLGLVANRDLRNLGRDRNVSDAVRSQAARLYMIKTR